MSLIGLILACYGFQGLLSGLTKSTDHLSGRSQKEDPPITSKPATQTPAWTWGSPRFPLKGSFKGDVDIGIDIDVDIDLALDARGT